jgi:hypothetical protein
MPFHDPGIPAGYHNFNIQSVGSWLVVTYAKIGANVWQAVGAGEGWSVGVPGEAIERYRKGSRKVLFT